MTYNTLKNTLIITSAAFFIAAFSFAYAMPGQHRMGPEAVNPEQVINQLNLDDDAKTKLTEIMQNHKAQMEAMHDNMQADRYEKFQAMKQIREAHRAEVKAVLSDEQFAQFEKAMWMQRHSVHEGRGPQEMGMRRPMPPME